MSSADIDSPTSRASFFSFSDGQAATPVTTGHQPSQRRSRALFTKSFSTFAMSSTKSNYKPVSKRRGASSDQLHSPARTPSINSEDSASIITAPYGKMTLRVINPDPVSDEDEDEEELEQHQEHQDHQDHQDHHEHHEHHEHREIVSSPTELDTSPTITSATLGDVPGSPSDLLAPAVPPKSPRAAAAVTATIVTATSIDPTTTWEPKHAISVENTGKRSSYRPTPPLLLRKQSKTLQEPPSLLPPLDLTPFDSSTLLAASPKPMDRSNGQESGGIDHTALLHYYNGSPQQAIHHNQPLQPPQQQQPLPMPPTPTTLHDRLVSVNEEDGDHPSASSTVPQPPTSAAASIVESVAPSIAHSTTTTASLNKFGQQYTTSKYAKASYTLTNSPESLRLYRSMAKKTKDKSVQFSYAQYLLEIASLYDQGRQVKHTRLSSLRSTVEEAGSRVRNELKQLSRHGLESASLGKTAQPLRSVHRPSVDFVSGSAQQFRHSIMPTSPTPASPAVASVSSFGTLASAASQYPSSNPNAPSVASSSVMYIPSSSTAASVTSTLSPDTLSHRKKKRALEEEGIRWIKQLAKDRYPPAAFTLASWMDQSKYGLTPNQIKSKELYQIAARGNIPEALYRLGLYYESLNDYQASFNCISEASKQGVAHATMKLAKVYLHGQLGQRQNMTLALELLQKAAQEADRDCPEPPFVFAQLLTNTYPKAEIPSEVLAHYGSVDVSVAYFERSAQLGYAPAHSALGDILEHGLYGCAVNYAESYVHYTEASKQGDHRGMLGLSRLNNCGCHGPNDKDIQHRIDADTSGWLAAREPNEESAFYWCERAADEGQLPDAHFLLAWYYEVGLGVPRDGDKANWYYHKAARQGFVDAKPRTTTTTTEPLADTRMGLPPPIKPSTSSQSCTLM
ncbi:hypothetical protein BC940DRAFT_312843 [Gongronella butleri]|nr:hypothetical protein BC940DRAFT_312843 [Gongronella butleri]